MGSTQPVISDYMAMLRHRLNQLRDEAMEFMGAVAAGPYQQMEHNRIEELLSAEDRILADDLAARARRTLAEISAAVGSAPLIDDADRRDLSQSAKSMAAAVHFRRHRYRGVYVHHDEDVV